MKTITVINAKGGCGKSTIAMSVAAGLSLRGKRVLLMDLDPQAQTTQWLSAGDGLRPEGTLVAALANHQSLTDVIQPTGYANISFVASSAGLEDLGREISVTDGYPAMLTELLAREYGPQWHQRFKRLSFEPVASASIGQVHRAETHAGEVLALKIQYPGVRQSIDSDVANVVSLLRMAGLVPRSLDIEPLVEEAKRQLHEEADYVKEGKHLAHYGELLVGSSDFVLPRVVEEFTRKNILAMSFIEGTPCGKRWSRRAPATSRVSPAPRPGGPGSAEAGL